MAHSLTKDEFVTAVWGGIAVTDDSLVQCITDIRKALGDDKHTIVRTVLKRGYVLEAAARAGTKPTHWPLGPVGRACGRAAGSAALAGFYLLPLKQIRGRTARDRRSALR